MGLFDKIKGLFYDEEEIDVPIVEKNPKNDNITIKSGNVALKEKEEINETFREPLQMDNESENLVNDVVSERDLVSNTQNFKFPIIFEDEDFAEIEKPREEKKEEKKVEEKKYQKPVLDRKVIDTVVNKPKKFKPTPIISPIYGILDKTYENNNKTTTNKSTYHREKEEMELNFDTIRKKAYGTLADDIEKELSKDEEALDKIENKIDNILEENNLLSNLEEKSDINKDEDNLYNYEDFGIEYKIDDSNKEKSKVEKKKSKKEVELTEDLFNLIDSMYDK